MFFFFKQKTAYEMRISDWSSDVCSSDLVEKRQTWSLRIGAICPAKVTAGVPPFRRAIVIGSSLVKNQKASATTASVTAQILSTPDQSKAIIVTGARKCVSEVTMLPIPKRPSAVPRSEEHTSELQSL